MTLHCSYTSRTRWLNGTYSIENSNHRQDRFGSVEIEEAGIIPVNFHADETVIMDSAAAMTVPSTGGLSIQLNPTDHGKARQRREEQKNAAE